MTTGVERPATAANTRLSSGQRSRPHHVQVVTLPHSRRTEPPAAATVYPDSPTDFLPTHVRRARQLVGEKLDGRRQRSARDARLCGCIAAAAAATMTTMTRHTEWIIHDPRGATTDRENVGSGSICDHKAGIRVYRVACILCVLPRRPAAFSSVLISAAAAAASPPTAYQCCSLCDPWHSTRSSSRADRSPPIKCSTSAVICHCRAGHTMFLLPTQEL